MDARPGYTDVHFLLLPSAVSWNDGCRPGKPGHDSGLKRIGPVRGSCPHSTAEMRMVTPPVAKFARSPSTARPSGDPMAAAIAASLSNQNSAIR